MVGTRFGMASGQPAKPLPGATWQAHVLDAEAITRELNRLWAEAAGDHRDEGNEHANGEHEIRPGGVLARASTLNLVAVARSEADAERVESAVTHLSELYPSRATILVADPARSEGSDAGLDVRVALLEQEGKKGRPTVRFECVTVEVSAKNERHLASIASPLLVADLPDFLWWASSSVTSSELFEDLQAVSDRLIVDSASFVDQGAGLRYLAALAMREQVGPKLSDFAWARLNPWRQLVTQFFDPPGSRAALDELDEVEISYGTAASGEGSGLSSALLLAGWLSSRLGWQAPGEVLPLGEEEEAWGGTLRALSQGRRREVRLTLRRRNDALAERCVGDVRLSSGGGKVGTFRIARTDASGLETERLDPTLAPVRRIVYASCLDDAALLADELRIFGRDPVYEEALSFAADLAPDVEDGAG